MGDIAAKCHPNRKKKHAAKLAAGDVRAFTDLIEISPCGKVINPGGKSSRFG